MKTGKRKLDEGNVQHQKQIVQYEGQDVKQQQKQIIHYKRQDVQQQEQKRILQHDPKEAIEEEEEL